MNYPTNYVCFDFETTGLNPVKDKPIEVAWVVVIDNIIVKAKKHLLNFHVDIPKEARAIHGISKDMIDTSEDAKTNPVSILQELMEDINQAEGVVTHNGTFFDIFFLLNNLPLPGKNLAEYDLRQKHFDTAAIYKGKGINLLILPHESQDTYARRVLNIHSPFKFNLKAAAKTYGIEAIGQHRAFNDVMTTSALYQKMCLTP